jgi:hypothetical protein
MKKRQENCLPTNLEAIISDVVRSEQEKGPVSEESELELDDDKSKRANLSGKGRCHLCLC